MNKEILFLSHMYPSNYDSSYGKVIHEQALSLIKKGYKIKVISPVPYVPAILRRLSKKYQKRNSIPKKEIIEGVEVYYPRYVSFPKSLFFQYSGYLMFSGIKNTVKQLNKSFAFDIIHAHFTLPDAYAAMKLSKLFNIPLITTIQASDLDISFKKNEKIQMKIMESLKFSSEVITPTPRLNKQLKKELNINSKTVGYGINPLKLDIDISQDLLSKYQGKKIIVSVSRLIRTKGIDYNLNAIKELVKKDNSIIYLIIGNGPEKNSLMELASELGISNHIEFLGHLTSENTMKYIKLADIFSLPSWQETFGLVYLEAMGSKVPVVGCFDQGFDGIIIDRKNGYLAPMHDVNALVNIMDKILKKPEDIEDVVLNARNTVINEYTFKKIAGKLDEIYVNTTK